MDLRHGAHGAPASRPPELVTALRERGIRADVPDWPAQLLDPVLPADPALPALPADPALAVPGQVLALTRLPRADAEEARALAALLAARPATIVVHAGVPAAAPDHRLLVLAHGGGLPLMRAAVDLLLRGAEEGRFAPSVTPTAP